MCVREIELQPNAAHSQPTVSRHQVQPALVRVTHTHAHTHTPFRAMLVTRGPLARLPLGHIPDSVCNSAAWPPSSLP